MYIYQNDSFQSVSIVEVYERGNYKQQFSTYDPMSM